MCTWYYAAFIHTEVLFQAEMSCRTCWYLHLVVEVRTIGRRVVLWSVASP